MNKDEVKSKLEALEQQNKSFGDNHRFVCNGFFCVECPLENPCSTLYNLNKGNWEIIEADIFKELKRRLHEIRFNEQFEQELEKELTDDV